jgi:hypothetical protein
MRREKCLREPLRALIQAIFSLPLAAMVIAGWLAHGVVVASAFLFILRSSEPYHPALNVFLIGMPILFAYGLVLAAIDLFSWRSQSQAMRWKLFSVLLLMPFTAGGFFGIGHLFQ